MQTTTKPQYGSFGNVMGDRGLRGGAGQAWTMCDHGHKWVVIVITCIAMTSVCCRQGAISPVANPSPAGACQDTNAHPNVTPALTNTFCESVDDRLCKQLSLRFEAMVAGTEDAYFVFSNRSSGIISLPSLHSDPIGPKLYRVHFVTYYVREGNRWNELYNRYGGGSEDIEVYPGTEVRVIVRLVPYFGKPTGKKVCKIGLGNIHSEPFSY